MLQRSLPRFAKARTFWELMRDEMSRRHDWFSIVTVYRCGQAGAGSREEEESK